MSPLGRLFEKSTIFRGGQRNDVVTKCLRCCRQVLNRDHIAAGNLTPCLLPEHLRQGDQDNATRITEKKPNARAFFQPGYVFANPRHGQANLVKVGHALLANPNWLAGAAAAVGEARPLCTLARALYAFLTDGRANGGLAGEQAGKERDSNHAPPSKVRRSELQRSAPRRWSETRS